MSPAGPSAWRGHHLPITLGVFALTFLFAFETIAASTVMPAIAADLHALSWYAVAFATPTAAMIVATTLAGPWIDRAGPRPAIHTGTAIFIAGLVVCGIAPGVGLFLLGRAVHGFGAGLVGVAVYVVVAQAYPEELRPRVFTILNAGWILPAILGPALAAHVADWWSWRWVFLGVPVLALLAWALVLGAPSRPGADEPRPMPWRPALVVAAGVFAISIAGQRELTGWPVLGAVGLGAIVLASPRLLPPGTWRGGGGLASVITVRSLVWAGYIGAEAYLPLLLVLQRGLSLAEAGSMLTVSTISWFAGSWCSSHLAPLRTRPRRALLAGLPCVSVGIVVVATAAAPAVPLVVPVLGWALATFGVGLVFPTAAVLAFAAVSDAEAGLASSALQLNDSLAQSVVLALGSVLFAALAATHPVAGATTLILVAAALSCLAWSPARRAGLEHG